MAIDDAVRAQRHRYIGSSDAAALLNKDPWAGPMDVWLEKTGRLGPRVDLENHALTLGQYLEPAVLSWCEDQLETLLVRDVSRVALDGVRAANLDALAVHADPAVLVEAKTTGLLGDPRYLHEFGDAGTDQVPAHVLLQVHHQLAVLEDQPDLPPVAYAVVPVLLARRGFVMFRVDKDAELVGQLREFEQRWWADHVVADCPPPDVPPSQLEILKRVQRVPDTRVAVPPDRVMLYLEAQRRRLDAEKIEEEAKRYLLAALDQAEAGECLLALPDETELKPYLVTYLEQSRREHLVKASTFRKLNVSVVKTPTPKKKELAHG